MRIAFLIRSLGVGGAERQLAVLATGLVARGHTVLVVAYYDGGTGSQKLATAGVGVVSLQKRARWDLVGPLVRLARAIRGFRPDLIHGYMPDGNLLALLAGRVIYRVPVVWGVRASWYDFRIYDPLFRALFRASCRVAHLADLIIANSVAGRAYHVGLGYPAETTVVVPNGIDTERFRPDIARRERQRWEWGMENDRPLIGIVGRLDPMKDHPTFLRSAALLAGQLPAARFVCIGEGPGEYRRELESLAREVGVADRIRWVPNAEDLVAAYNALDLLVSVSASAEGFPNVIGEAMACGVRCAVTSAGDSAEIVNGTGTIVPMGDATAIAEGWRRALTHQVEPVRPDPRTRIEAEFSVERLVTRTEQLLGAKVAASGRSAL